MCLWLREGIAHSGRQDFLNMVDGMLCVSIQNPRSHTALGRNPNHIKTHRELISRFPEPDMEETSTTKQLVQNYMTVLFEEIHGRT